MHLCAVCENPRKADLTTSQIEWHNMGHPGVDRVRTFNGPSRVRSVVIIRPGDQVLYEIEPGSWRRIDELDIAVAAGHGVSRLSTTCKRCLRPVLERRLSQSGFWRLLIERIALRGLRRAS